MDFCHFGIAMTKLDLGAQWIGEDTVRFTVWAPRYPTLHLHLMDRPPVPMNQDGKGYFRVEVDRIKEGDLYFYQLPNKDLRPDPVSRFLPEGVRGPSMILRPEFAWTDAAWKLPPQHQLIFYECHVGTFSPEGTFLGILKCLDHLKKLGANVLSLMPCAQFPGKCNWGYDWASAYAPHQEYGTPSHFKQLVNACHKEGIAVCLDVVYNHSGPEGWVLEDFGFYLSKKYSTNWGATMNFDGPHSDEVRRFFILNALYWIEEFHIDILRLDATHAIIDNSAIPFLKQLNEAVHGKALVIVENNLNDSRHIRPHSQGGYGAQMFWGDDFYYALRSLCTHEQEGFYRDYAGNVAELKQILQASVLYDGTRYSRFRSQTYGNSFEGIEPEQMVVFSQNHDQVGNRPLGDRYAPDFPWQKVTAFLTVLSPYLPLLFMGQEYNEESPFEYFVDFEDKDLIEAAFQGRKKEFGYTDESIPYPDHTAFLRSKLQWKIQPHLFALYCRLIAFRKSLPLLKREQIHVEGQDGWIGLHYGSDVTVFCAFAGGKFPLPGSCRKVLFHTEQQAFGGQDNVQMGEGSVTTGGPVGIVLQQGLNHERTFIL